MPDETTHSPHQSLAVGVELPMRDGVGEATVAQSAGGVFLFMLVQT